MKCYFFVFHSGVKSIIMEFERYELFEKMGDSNAPWQSQITRASSRIPRNSVVSVLGRSPNMREVSGLIPTCVKFFKEIESEILRPSLFSSRGAGVSKYWGSSFLILR